MAAARQNSVLQPPQKEEAVMKKAVHFGAGKIGRGFIAELLFDSGYEIIFADVVQEMVEQINQTHSYRLFRIEQDYEEKLITNVSALSSIHQQSEIIEAILEAEVVTTSVMATNLPKIAPLLARALRRRCESGKEKLTVMACENAIMGTDILKKAMADTGLITEEMLDAAGVYPNTAVDRIVFDGIHDGKEGIEIGEAYELAIERNKLIDPSKEPIAGAEYVDNLEMVLQRKIYMINCGHALCGYIGQQHGYEIVQDALRDPVIQAEVTAAVMESAAALERKYGYTHEELERYMNIMMLKRFLTPGLSDPIARVAREPIRKISPNDRIMGPACQCEKYGLENRHLLKGAAYALRFHNEADEQAVKLQAFIKEQGIEAAITKYTGAPADSRSFRVILEEYNRLDEEKICSKQ